MEESENRRPAQPAVPLSQQRIGVKGIFECIDNQYGFIRSDMFRTSGDDTFVGLDLVKQFGLRTGDLVEGIAGSKEADKSRPLIYIQSVNNDSPFKSRHRPVYETLTPVFPNEKFQIAEKMDSLALKVIDSISPIGKGQRGIIASPPKSGKTTILKDIAKSLVLNHPESYIFVVLIDERPEEVTDFIDSVSGDNVEIAASTFDEMPEHHRRVAELTLERAKRLVEAGKDAVILMDSITRLTRAYNLLVDSSGKTLSGGIDPAAFYAPKRMFGAARNIRGGGSLTIIATALIETGSKMDDVIYEEFKGTGNMELVLSRRLQEMHIFPAIDVSKSGTRRDDLLLTPGQQKVADMLREKAGQTTPEYFFRFVSKL